MSDAPIGADLPAYRPRIYAYIARRVADHDTAADLTSETILRALEAEAAGKGPRTSFSGWLFRIAHNLVVDHYRERTRWQVADIDALDPGHAALVVDDDLAAQAAAREQIARIHHLIAGLPDQQSTALRLRAVGYTAEDTAALLGKSVGAVRSALHLARGHLARHGEPNT
jgi:RNA polymerase sigma-70 factor (ECF subfamily)